MKKTIVLSMTLLLFLGCVALGDEAKEDAKIADGTWVPESAELAGIKFPDEVLKTMKLVLKGDEYTVTIGKRTDKGTVKRDPTKKPKTIDVIGTEGPNKGKTIPAIYELTKDTLKVCYDLSGKERPKTFETKADTQLFLVTYKREKP